MKERQVDRDVYTWEGPRIRNAEKLDFHQVFFRRPSMMAAWHPGQSLRIGHLWQSTRLDHGLVQFQMWSASVSRTGVNHRIPSLDAILQRRSDM